MTAMHMRLIIVIQLEQVLVYKNSRAHKDDRPLCEKIAMH